MLQKLLSFLDSVDTERRIAATIVGVALPLINAHLTTPLPSEQVIGAMTLLLGYVIQSAAKSISAAKNPTVTTVDQAIKVLQAIPPVPVPSPPVIVPVKP